VALDDLGAGYSGLSTFAQLQPEIVKLDMSLIRELDRHPTKQRIVRSMLQLCGDLGMRAVCEGIESAKERDALVAAGCDLLQGYLFARPARCFQPVVFEDSAARRTESSNASATPG
jgi:EAL domain-containing protein (putative c-di-GMP-specific phosphodiesterase class I)